MVCSATSGAQGLGVRRFLPKVDLHPRTLRRETRASRPLRGRYVTPGDVHSLEDAAQPGRHVVGRHVDVLEAGAGELVELRLQPHELDDEVAPGAEADLAPSVSAMRRSLPLPVTATDAAWPRSSGVNDWIRLAAAMKPWAANWPGSRSATSALVIGR